MGGKSQVEENLKDPRRQPEEARPKLELGMSLTWSARKRGVTSSEGRTQGRERWTLPGNRKKLHLFGASGEMGLMRLKRGASEWFPDGELGCLCLPSRQQCCVCVAGKGFAGRECYGA